MHFTPSSRYFSHWFFEGEITPWHDAVSLAEPYVLQYVGYHTVPPKNSFNYCLTPTDAYQEMIEQKKPTNAALYMRDDSADLVIPENENIGEISIANNGKLTSIDLSNCHGLKRLTLVNNHFLHTIKGLGSLRNLKELTLGSNCLSAIPDFEELLRNNPDLKLNIDIAFVPELKRRINNFWEFAKKVGFIEEISASYITMIGNDKWDCSHNMINYNPVSLLDLRLIDEAIGDTITYIGDFDRSSLSDLSMILVHVRKKQYNLKTYRRSIEDWDYIDRISFPHRHLEEPIRNCCLLRSSVLDNDTICQGSAKHAQYLMSSLGYPAIRVYKTGHVIAAFEVGGKWFGAESTATGNGPIIIESEEELIKDGFRLPPHLEFAKKEVPPQNHFQTRSYGPSNCR